MFLQFLATSLGLHPSGHQVWCSNAAMQPALLDESSNWLGHVGRCLYAKGQVQVLQAWQIWGTSFLHLIAPQLALKKAVRRFGTMPMVVKTAVTDMHRCDSCLMWQARAEYSKHLENRSVSSLHPKKKWHQIKSFRKIHHRAVNVRRW